MCANTAAHQTSPKNPASAPALFFHRAGAHALNHRFLRKQEEDYKGNGNNQRTGSKIREFIFLVGDKSKKAKCKRLLGRRAQHHLGEDKIHPRPGKAGNPQEGYNRLCDGQDNGTVNPEVACTVNARCLVQILAHRIHVAFYHPGIVRDIPRNIHKHKAPQGIKSADSKQDNVDCNHADE